MKRRVVVTGLGAITPIGNSVEEFWNNVKAEKTGFAPITYFDTTDYRCKLAAQVKDFDPAQYMDKKAACFLQDLFGKKCRTFWRILHLQIGENCRGTGRSFFTDRVPVQA